MDKLTIMSRDGVAVAFEVTRRAELETFFDVVVHAGEFSGRASASTYHIGSPFRLFQAMATDWKGWRGEKQWEDMDHYVRLTATSDSTGHIRMQVDLAGTDYETRLRSVFLLYAGELERLASDVGELFGDWQ